MASPLEAVTEPASILSTAADLAALDRMSGPELIERYLNIFGEPPRSRNKVFLRKRLAWRIQELAEGGLSEKTLERIKELGPTALAAWKRPGRSPSTPRAKTPQPERDPRLPKTGTVLRRTYSNVEYVVTVLDRGFEYQGETYRSLSKIARVVTGTPWNGYLFFLGRAGGKREQSS